MNRGDTEVVLYSMRSTLNFFSPVHPLLGPLLHACNECEALGMLRSKITLSVDLQQTTVSGLLWDLVAYWFGLRDR